MVVALTEPLFRMAWTKPCFRVLCAIPPGGILEVLSVTGFVPAGICTRFHSPSTPAPIDAWSRNGNWHVGIWKAHATSPRLVECAMQLLRTRKLCAIRRHHGC